MQMFIIYQIKLKQSRGSLPVGTYLVRCLFEEEVYAEGTYNTFRLLKYTIKYNEEARSYQAVRSKKVVGIMLAVGEVLLLLLFSPLHPVLLYCLQPGSMLLLTTTTVSA